MIVTARVLVKCVFADELGSKLSSSPRITEFLTNLVKSGSSSQRNDQRLCQFLIKVVLVGDWAAKIIVPIQDHYDFDNLGNRLFIAPPGKQ